MCVGGSVCMCRRGRVCVCVWVCVCVDGWMDKCVCLDVRRCGTSRRAKTKNGPRELRCLEVSDRGAAGGASRRASAYLSARWPQQTGLGCLEMRARRARNSISRRANGRTWP